MIPRLKEQFNTELKQKIMSDLQLSNVNEIPSLEKIIINIGDGKAATDGRALESMVDELTAISGQKPVIRRAKKSIAGFKIREGMAIGTSVTLRGDRMWEFYDRFVQVVVPRIRDFRGFNKKSFDGNGNYTLYAERRQELLKVSKDPNTSYDEKREAQKKIAKMPRDASATRHRNRCEVTGRPRGTLRKFGMSRNTFRDLALKGELPGIKKASW